MRNTCWLDKGSAATITIMTLASISVLVLGVAFALSVAREQTRLQQLADLTALAGSDSRIGIIAGFPCPNAGEIAWVNGANLLSCRIVGEVVSIEVGKTILGLSLFAKAEAAPNE